MTFRQEQQRVRPPLVHCQGLPRNLPPAPRPALLSDGATLIFPCNGRPEHHIHIHYCPQPNEWRCSLVRAARQRGITQERLCLASHDGQTSAIATLLSGVNPGCLATLHSAASETSRGAVHGPADNIAHPHDPAPPDALSEPLCTAVIQEGAVVLMPCTAHNSHHAHVQYCEHSVYACPQLLDDHDDEDITLSIPERRLDTRATLLRPSEALQEARDNAAAQVTGSARAQHQTDPHQGIVGGTSDSQPTSTSRIDTNTPHHRPHTIQSPRSIAFASQSSTLAYPSPPASDRALSIVFESDTLSRSPSPASSATATVFPAPDDVQVLARPRSPPPSGSMTPTGPPARSVSPATATATPPGDQPAGTQKRRPQAGRFAVSTERCLQHRTMVAPYHALCFPIELIMFDLILDTLRLLTTRFARSPSAELIGFMQRVVREAASVATRYWAFTNNGNTIPHESFSKISRTLAVIWRSVEDFGAFQWYMEDKAKYHASLEATSKELLAATAHFIAGLPRDACLELRRCAPQIATPVPARLAAPAASD